MTETAETLHEPDGWADSGPREAQAHPGIHGTWHRYGHIEWWEPESLYGSDYRQPICPVMECASGEPHECRIICQRITTDDGRGAWECGHHGYWRAFDYPRTSPGEESEQATLVPDGGAPQSQIQCLGCGNIENSVKEYRRHVARAGHVDQGETYL